VYIIKGGEYRIIRKPDIDFLQNVCDELGAEKYFISEWDGSYQVGVYFYINYEDCKTKLDSMEIGLL